MFLIPKPYALVQFATGGGGFPPGMVFTPEFHVLAVTVDCWSRRAGLGGWGILVIDPKTAATRDRNQDILARRAGRLLEHTWQFNTRGECVYGCELLAVRVVQELFYFVLYITLVFSFFVSSIWT